MALSSLHTASTAPRQAALALEDGSLYVGEAFGAHAPAAGEVVFNTGITGYQEVATDPSYRGQMVVMTHPQIGNYGVSASGEESIRPWITAMVVRDVSDRPHHWESRETLSEYFQRWGIPGLRGIDTRALVRRLREKGTLRGVLQHSAPGGFSRDDLNRLQAQAGSAPSVSQLELVSDVSGILPTPIVPSSIGEVAVVDCGAKWNILRSLARRGVRPHVFPWTASAAEVLDSNPRAILVSNGPGDPESLQGVVRELRTLAQSGTPLLGICLGHQLLGLAAGGTTSRLRYGHHGGNHPVRDLETGRVTITTQNHEFQVDRASVPEASGFVVSQVNLNDHSVEGLRHRELPVFSVQYHPEGCPGPQDSQPLFDDLLALAGIRTAGDAIEGAEAWERVRR